MSKTLDWKAAILAAIVAGIVFMMLQMILVAVLQGQSPWAPPRMLAAMVLGKGVLPPPAPFDFGVMMVAMMVHFMMSIILGIIFALLASRFGFGMTAALVGGVVFGLIVYFVDFYVFTGIFPWFAKARTPITIFDHAMFGAVLGGVYSAIASRDGKMDRPAAA